MDEKLKQRLVGLMVLVALAIIFLPSLFHKDEPVEIDTSSLIPPAPQVEPVVVPEPIKPVDVTPADGQVFAVPVEALEEQVKPEPEAEVEIASKPAPIPAPELAPEPEPQVKPQQVLPDEPPSLTSQGVPKGWLLQVASLKLQESAENLVKSLEKDQYPAYAERATTAQGDFYRVFIGPFIDPKQAEQVKQKVDKAYKVESRVLRFNPLSGD